jgi:glutathione synthase/RimK-type ligase-like ATP-grasp enzyme
MQAAGVPVPETWDVTDFRNMSRYDNDYTADEFVLRRANHAQGRDLWYGSMDEVVQAAVDNAVHNGYVSIKIDKVAEYRVMVVQNRVAWVAKKTPGNPEDVAWNVAQGGRFDNVRWGDWPMRVVVAAVHAAEVSGTDFCGVDVMVDAEGLPYVLEVNSAPSQTSPYRQQCLAKCFDYIVTNGKEHLPDHRGAGWKYYIHPAVMGDSDG